VSQRIVVLVRDLLFSSRIGETARRLGYPCRAARSVADLEAALAEPTGLLMVDLTAQALDLDAALRAIEAAGRPAPVLAWTTHALWKTTRPLHERCDRVVTREELTEKLPELLRSYLDDPTPSS
jgi:DNA-binding NtrC family response regulator